MIGKPYSGKLNVRFDEGELEIEPRLLRQFPTLLNVFLLSIDVTAETYDGIRIMGDEVLCCGQN
jgi:hypothetical protein